jgi:uncharacterized HAD superfamily protein
VTTVSDWSGRVRAARSCLLLDIDGVLGDLMGASCAAVNRRFGTRHSAAQAVDYSLSFLNDEEREWLQHAWYETDLLEKLDAYPEVVARVLTEQPGFDVTVVATDREPRAYARTERWLPRLGLRFDRLFVQFGAKLAALAELPADCRVLLFDDRPIPALLSDPRVRVVVPERPWNRDIGAYDAFRVAIGDPEGRLNWR